MADPRHEGRTGGAESVRDHLVADYCTFYSGEYATDTALRPNLVVDYEYP